jgi:hypothetical protein
MARSLHASYLSRWSRHDPAGLERASNVEEDRRKAERPETKKSSAA